MEELIQLLYLKRSNIILALAVFVFLAFSLIGVTHAISDKKISSSFTTYSVPKGQNLNLVIEDLADSEFQKFFIKIYAHLYNFEEIKFGITEQSLIERGDAPLASFLGLSTGHWRRIEESETAR